MSTDRKLLEDAAKAAGYLATQFNEYGWFYVCTYPGNPPGDPAEFELWNPLTSDGDALRLAVKLRMVGIDCYFWHDARSQSPASAGVGEGAYVVSRVYEPADYSSSSIQQDPYAATRRAIVRAAAAIGAAK